MSDHNWNKYDAADLHDIVLENMSCLRAGTASEEMLDTYERLAVKALDLLYKKTQQGDASADNTDAQ